MDSVVLGLSVAIAIVVVLLLSCWDKKPAKAAAPRQQVAAPSRSQCVTKSTFGQGVANRESKNRYQDLADLKGYDDYNSVAQYMSVEPEVYASHSRYAKDMGSSTSGASMLPVRDDPSDVVPWVGLRKPKYQQAYACEGARQEHSEIPDQMRAATFYCVG